MDQQAVRAPMDPHTTRVEQGQRLATLRRQRGLTQRQVSKWLGISRQYVGGLEHGRHPLNTKRIKLLAKLLQYRRDELRD
jgi:transcriptional regulator with XRE-family HTH domain